MSQTIHRMKIVINLHCEPNTPPREWAEFLTNAPSSSIAIDGYVIGPAKFDAARVIMNANHHEGVDRLSTRCTAVQLALQIRMGLFKAFRSQTAINVFFNDCDQDVCLSIWLLRNSAMSEGVVNPTLNRMLHIEDMLDTTAGGYGFHPETDGLLENNWVFEPYAIARSNGTLFRRDSAEFVGVVEAVSSRIDMAVAGKGKRLPLDVRYEIMNRTSEWAMVRELGSNARIGMASDGIRAFVSVYDEGGGRYRYSVGRSGIWVPFDMDRIISALNEAEGDPVNLWGGSDTIGGSPRATGSKLTPDQVQQIITTAIA